MVLLPNRRKRPNAETCQELQAAQQEPTAHVLVCGLPTYIHLEQVMRRAKILLSISVGVLRSCLKPQTTGLNISNLPVELIERILDANLRPKDLCAFRLTCRGLCYKSTHNFYKAVFGTYRTDLSSQSIAKLESLGRNDNVRTYLRTLCIELFPESTTDSGLKCYGHGLKISRDNAGRIKPSSEVYQTLQDLLTSIFLNCRSFRLVNHTPMETHRDVHDPLLMGADVFNVLLSLFARSQLRVSSWDSQFQYLMDLRRINTNIVDAPGFQTAWASLNQLFLDHSLRDDTLGFTSDLILTAKNLKVLHIDFHYSTKVSGLLQCLNEAQELPPLEELDFRCANHIPAELLVSLFRRLGGTMRSLTIQLVYLEHEHHWKPVLESIRTNLTSLRRFSIWYCFELIDDTTRYLLFPKLDQGQTVIGSEQRRFRFRKWSSEAIERIVGVVNGVSYEGPDMNIALEKICRTASSDY